MSKPIAFLDAVEVGGIQTVPCTNKVKDCDDIKVHASCSLPLHFRISGIITDISKIHSDMMYVLGSDNKLQFGWLNGSSQS